MIRYAEALARLLRAADARLMPSELAPRAEVVGRVTASRVLSREDLPAFDNSAMDGYAVSAAETRAASPGSPVRLAVKGKVAAGDSPSPQPSPRGRGSSLGIAYEIATGAPLPTGMDAVVKVEDVRVSGSRVELTSPAEEGDFVRRRGQDMRAGGAVAEAGTWLDARHILAFAALGVDHVPVKRRPKVALISTGSELAAPGEAPGPGRIRNATADYLAAALPHFGAALAWQAAVPDETGIFLRRLETILGERPDLVLTTGAVSMGGHDFVPRALEELGAELLFHKAAVRPGKPVLAARLKDGPLVISLPGNPLSTAVGLRFLVAPVLRRWLGLPDEHPLTAELSGSARKPEGLRCFYKARLALSGGRAAVRVLEGQASFQILPLLEANAWAVLPEEGETVEQGAMVEVHPLFPSSDEADAELPRAVESWAGRCC